MLTSASRDIVAELIGRARNPLNFLLLALAAKRSASFSPAPKKTTRR